MLLHSKVREEHHTEVNILHINQAKPQLEIKKPFNNDLKTRFKQLHNKMDTMHTKHSELTQTLHAFAANHRNLTQADVRMFLHELTNQVINKNNVT